MFRKPIKLDRVQNVKTDATASRESMCFVFMMKFVGLLIARLLTHKADPCVDICSILQILV